MSKLRSVNTQFWSDPWVEELSADEKLIYLYFITNEKTNMLGVYELSIRKISFETGIKKETIVKALKGFETINKVKYTKNFIVLLNFAKHQNYNPNMKKSAIDVYNKLPNELKDSNEHIDKLDYVKGFERVLKGLGMVRKVEVETKVETKVEDKNKETKKQVYKSFDHKLKENYSKEAIDNILESIENFNNNKKYKSLLITARNWLKREHGQKSDSKTKGNEHLNMTF